MGVECVERSRTVLDLEKRRKWRERTQGGDSLCARSGLLADVDYWHGGIFQFGFLGWVEDAYKDSVAVNCFFRVSTKIFLGNCWNWGIFRTLDSFGARLDRINQINLKEYNFMAVAIRLRREGNKNRPFFRIVVTDSRARRDGNFIEQIGTYDPLVEGKNFTIDLEKVDKWVGNGAQPSDKVKNLIKYARKETAEA